LRRKLKIEKAIIKKEEEEKNKDRNFNLPLLDFNEEDELRASTANFRQNKNILFNVRDSKRLESIMSFNPGYQTTKNPTISNNNINNTNINNINNNSINPTNPINTFNSSKQFPNNISNSYNRLNIISINGNPIKNHNNLNNSSNQTNNFLTQNQQNKYNLNQIAKNNNLKDLIFKKHNMDISLQKSLEREMKKEREISLSTAMFKKVEKIDNGLLLGRKTFLKKKV